MAVFLHPVSRISMYKHHKSQNYFLKNTSLADLFSIFYTPFSKTPLPHFFSELCSQPLHNSQIFVHRLFTAYVYTFSTTKLAKTSQLSLPSTSLLPQKPAVITEITNFDD
jgi:hypothetical protein